MKKNIFILFIIFVLTNSFLINKAYGDLSAHDVYIGVLAALKAFISNLVQTTFTGVYNALTQGIQNFIMQPIQNLVYTAQNAVYNLGNMVIGKITDTIQHSISGLLDQAYQGLLAPLMGQMGQFFGQVGNMFTQTLGKLVSKPLENVLNIKNYLESLTGKLPLSVQNAVSNLFDEEGLLGWYYMAPELAKNHIYENLYKIYKAQRKVEEASFDPMSVIETVSDRTTGVVDTGIFKVFHEEQEGKSKPKPAPSPKPSKPSAPTQGDSTKAQSNAIKILSNIIKFLFSALMIISGGLLIFSGIKYATGWGSVQEIHKSLLYLIIGIVLLATSFFIPNLIKSFIESSIK